MTTDADAIERCVVVATYNELQNLPALVAAIFDSVPDVRLIIVDDNSPDGSPAVLKDMAAKDSRLLPLIRKKKDGYGGAVLAGFDKALSLGARQVATLDADFSHDPASIAALFEGLNTADIVIGSRYAGGVRVLNWQPSRLLLSLFANRYVSTILGLKVSDATSGFRAYRREPLELIASQRIRSTGYSFLVEVLYRLVRRGFSVAESPIVYTERREGQSKMSRGVILEAVFRPWVLKLGGVSKRKWL